VKKKSKILERNADKLKAIAEFEKGRGFNTYTTRIAERGCGTASPETGSKRAGEAP
jgi:hypothetical protein